MHLGGCQKLTLLDFPGHTACTVFTDGCNLRCPFCHNASLVDSQNAKPSLTEEEFFEFLDKRHGLLDGVAITGGEPLLQKDIIPFIQKIRERGFEVKLDTNGTIPSVLKQILDAHLVQYVAMDIKNCKEKYGITAGVPHLDLNKIEESIALLTNSLIPFEFRTTVVKELHTEKDLLDIVKWLPPNVPYFLQNFVDSGDILEENMSGYENDQMRAFLTAIKPLNPRAELRGV
ncbi:MAG: anaerobic ribonucleoside-triphosphate reductase activating protein [Clostridia bacterium]|nr:anaerobic ribonucleoside-triphosphate reductase activating protein [Clostridia bacterium]